MAVSSIQIGQVWREDATGENFLVTKVYSEVFDSYAVMRKTSNATESIRRVKVQKNSEGVLLPGFSCDQDYAV
ncbi:MAG: hypothetical protein O6850_07405 [Acidobacteria bacterium]|nr:hypothetical protein [Acidobacteriota bacterium]